MLSVLSYASWSNKAGGIATGTGPTRWPVPTALFENRNPHRRLRTVLEAPRAA